MFASEVYKRIMHNINNEGRYSDCIFQEEEHDDHTVPTIYTQEEDDAIMKEFNETMYIPTPKANYGSMKEATQQDIAPVCIVKINYIGGIRLDRPLVCLLDTGSTGTMVQYRCLPPGATPRTSNEKRITTTINGSFDTSQSIDLTDISLPEFVNGRTINGIDARLFDSPTCRYDIIFGRDFLRKTNMKFCFARNIVDWMGASITMKPVNHYNMLADAEDVGLQPQDSLFIQYLNLILDQEDEEEFEEESMLLERSYSNVEPSEVVEKQNHLSKNEKEILSKTLGSHRKLFDGKLGKVPNYKFKIELKPNSTPSFQRQFPIPYKYQNLFKRELQNMIDDGVMSKRTQGSRWAAPSFCRPKKDDRIRIVTDFRELNKRVLRKQYPLPKIQDVMRRQQGYKYFTKIDLSMQYWCFE